MAWGDLTDVYKYLMEGNEEESAKLFSVVSNERTRGNRHKLKYVTFHLNTRKHFFYCEGG